jgi:hypothetical protein
MTGEVTGRVLDIVVSWQRVIVVDWTCSVRRRWP